MENNDTHTRTEHQPTMKFLPNFFFFFQYILSSEAIFVIRRIEVGKPYLKFIPLTECTEFFHLLPFFLNSFLNTPLNT